MSPIKPSQIQKFLKGIEYPASKDALLQHAKTRGADENACTFLKQLPDDDYQTPADVSQALGRLSGGKAGAQGAQRPPEQVDFLAQAMQDSLAEIEMCELALERSTNDDIKVFSQHVIDEHSRMGQMIEQLASKKQRALPKDVMPEHQSMIDALSQLSGEEFDRQFVACNLKEHEKDMQMFRDCAEQESDTNIRGLAERGAQMLNHHLTMVRQIGRRLPG